MTTWNKNQPIGSMKVKDVDDVIRENNTALEEALSREHTFPGTYGSTAGIHLLGETSVLKSDTKANLGTGTGVVGALSYATDENLIYRDTGSSITSMGNIEDVHVLGETSVLKVDTKSNLGTGTAVVGALSYASDESIIYRDTGTDIAAITFVYVLPAVGEVPVLKVGTKSSLGTGTGDTGALSYATDENLIYRDTGSNISSISAISIPAGEKIYFYANTAPAGWTIDTGIADKVLAVKGGSQAYNISGGGAGGTWTQPSHTLTTTEIPSHRHTLIMDGRGGPYSNYGCYSADPAAYAYAPYNTGYAGGGTGHSHGATTYRPLAAVGIIATKD